MKRTPALRTDAAMAAAMAAAAGAARRAGDQPRRQR